MKKLLSWMLVLTMSFSFMSCSKNDNNDPQGGEVEALNTVLLPYQIEVRLISNGYSYSTYCGVEVHKDVLKCYRSHQEVYAVQQICIGKVNKLSDIKSVPATGWQTDDLPVQEGYGYLVRVRADNQWFYKRLYIKEVFVIGGDDWYCKMVADFGDNWDPLSAL